MARTAKKRSYKRRRSSKSRTASKVSFDVKKYVKNTIHRGVENKYHLAFNAQQSLSPPFVLSLVPIINQGNQHSQRVGNSITLMSSCLEFVVNNKIWDAATNPFGTVIYRYFILSQIKDNSGTFDSGGFFEINNSSTNIQNNHLDQLFRVNASKYKVHKQGRFTLGTTSASNAYTAVNNVFDNNKFSIHKRIYFNKYLNKKIRYDDNGTTPTNTNCWLVILPTYANGTTTSSTTPGNISYSIHHNYEDS